MSPIPTPHHVLYVSSAAELRDRFDASHATAAELWPRYWKEASGRPSVTRSKAVDVGVRPSGATPP